MQKPIKMKKISIFSIIVNSFLLLIFSAIQNFSNISPYRLCQYIHDDLYFFLFKRFLLFVLLFGVIIIWNIILKYIYKILKIDKAIITNKMYLIFFLILLVSFIFNIYNILNYNCTNIQD
jgi:hypothetical protein